MLRTGPTLGSKAQERSTGRHFGILLTEIYIYIYIHNYFTGSREEVDVRRSPREHLKCDTSKIIKKFHPHYLLCFDNARSIEKCHI